MSNDVKIATLEKEVKELKADNKRMFQMLERMAGLKDDIDRLFLMVERLADMSTAGVKIDNNPAWQGTVKYTETGERQGVENGTENE